MTIAAGQTPTLTLLFDLSRMLRFYDGVKGNTGGEGPGARTTARFFADSLFTGYSLNGVNYNVAPVDAFYTLQLSKSQ